MIRKIARYFLWNISALPYVFSSAHSRLVIVSAADHTHGQSLQQLIRSVLRWIPDAEFICYDLGMTPDQRSQTENLLARFLKHDLRFFQFDAYPPHFEMSKCVGQYAWKPAIIREVSINLREATVFWLDAGNVVRNRLSWLRKVVRKEGFYSPWSIGGIADWTHFDLVNRLQFPVNMLNHRNLNAAVIGIDCSNSCTQGLIDRWFQCALDESCISPPGSSRINHRQDQSALTLLAYQSGFVKSLQHHFLNELWEPSGVSTHCDID